MHKKNTPNTLNQCSCEMLGIYAIEYNERLLYPFIVGALGLVTENDIELISIAIEVASSKSCTFSHSPFALKTCCTARFFNWTAIAVCLIEFILMPIEFPSKTNSIQFSSKMRTIHFKRVYSRILCNFIRMRKNWTRERETCWAVMTLQCNL